MDQEVVQRTRYLLRARFRRAQSCPPKLFAITCKQLHVWLSSHPVIAGHLHGIKREGGEAAVRVKQIAADLAAKSAAPRGARARDYGSHNPGFYSASTLGEHAAVCLAMLEVLAGDEVAGGDEFLLCCLGEYVTGNDNIKFEEALQAARDVALDGLFEYLDEHLDSRNVVLGLLAKYKQRGEWFRRDDLRALASFGPNARTGERALAMDLYEYLLDQGVEFFVEPVSSSGEPDVVLREPGGNHVVLDAKYIRQGSSPSEIRRKLAAGFHQVARYCNDYQEAAGHLIVFSESLQTLSLDLDDADGWRFLSIGGRVVYYSEVWIADAPSASKLGKAEEIAVSKSDLLDLPAEDKSVEGGVGGNTPSST